MGGAGLFVPLLWLIDAAVFELEGADPLLPAPAACCRVSGCVWYSSLLWLGYVLFGNLVVVVVVLSKWSSLFTVIFVDMLV